MEKDDRENIQTPLLNLGVDAIKKGITNISSASPSTKEDRQEIFIPVSGFVWLYPEEIKVLNHPAFQRLGNIYQLGHTFLVYRGATHKRFEHAIGTLHVVQRMIDAVNHNCAKDDKRNNRKRSGDNPGIKIKLNEERFIRLGALLHDIGHIALGHTIEDELCLVNKHDSDARLKLIFNDNDKKWVAGDVDSLGALIDKEFAKYVPDDLKSIKPSTIVHLLISKPPKENKSGSLKEEEYGRERTSIQQSSSIRLEVCRDMIGNTICADLLDYLHRDWYHVGKPKTFDERILQYMEVVGDGKDVNGHPKVSSTNEFVISIGKRPKIRTDAVSAILELLEWRYQLAESVHFHRTKLATAAMLDRALYELWKGDESEANRDVEKIMLPLSEEQLLLECLTRAETVVNSEQATARAKERAKTAKKLLLALKDRRLYTNLCTYIFDDLSPDIRKIVRDKYAKSPLEPNTAPSDRTSALRILEDDFERERGSIVMYCPTEGMSAKIAEVKIKVNNVVKKFNDYEQENNDQLTGGHLDAQLKRYGRLWRVHFFIDRKEKEDLKEKGLFETLLLTIDKLVLNNLTDGEQSESVALTLVSRMNAKVSKLESSAVEKLIAAYRHEITYYPFGGPSLRSVIKIIETADANSTKKST